MNVWLALQVVLCLINCIACTPYPNHLSPISLQEAPPFLHHPPQQSPINICTRQAVPRHLPALQFLNPLSEFAVISVSNNGKGVDLRLANEDIVKPRISGGPLSRFEEFAFDNLHFHWGPTDCTGSEHEFNDNRLAMEAHFVHFNYKYGTVEEAMKHADGLAVVGYLLKAGDRDNPEFERLVRLLPEVEFPEQSVTVRARDVLGWVPARWKTRGYYTYPGSLTTPPYAENVIWIVYPKPIYISSRQVQHFRHLISEDDMLLTHNSRAVQPLNDRCVTHAV